MASYEAGDKPTSNKIKPLGTSDTVELDHAGMGTVDPQPVQHKLVLRPWRVRFWDQLTALTYKQLLVYSRNARATILRLLAPLFFMFLLWLLDLAYRSDTATFDAFVNNPDPRVIPVAGIPQCNKDVFMRQDGCWDFIYSPNTSTIAQSIANNMRLNNPGRVISESAVQGFASIADANLFLAANPERVLGGVHFLLDANAPSPPPGPGLDYVLQVNSTVRYFKARFQDPTFFSAVPLQVSVEREIARAQLESAGRGAQPLTWNVSFSEFAHPQVLDVNIIGAAMGPFVFAANMFNFVLLLSSVVAERERGLRQALKTSGMLDSAFWLSWAIVELAISVLFTLLTIAFGAMFQFKYFLNNSFAVVFLLFLLFQWAMVGVAFLLSTIISRTSTAINLGFVIFILGWVLQTAIAFDFPYSPDNINSSTIITVIFTLLPFAILSKGAVDLGKAAEYSDSGITWSRRTEYCQNINNPVEQDALYRTAPTSFWDFECVFPVGNILTILFIEAIVYVLIAVYLNNVLADENGVRKKPWYLFTINYWRGGGSGAGGIGPRALKPSVPVPVADGNSAEPTDPDVAAEEDEMKALREHRTSGQSGALAAAADNTNAVEVFGLQRKFGRGFFYKLFCGLCRKGRGDFWAIKGSWLSIEKDRVFCLLGPNGAGKTTTINCLTGVLPPTGGDALVYGESITSAGGMERIRAVMGVCPQFDVLWNELTGAEHLYIYGRVKGLPAKQVAAQAEGLLDSVKLTSAAAQRTAAYSGGMRRRLSVAISLLGDPLIVYLDEPTTGMDPISRRHVWDVIEASKAGRAIVLTTHSMEEADILGDTVAIMARGKVRAYGSSLRLKQRFGSGYQLALAVAGRKKVDKNGNAIGAGAGDVDEIKTARVKALTELFDKELGVTAPEAGTGAYVVYLVPKSAEEALPGFLRGLEEHKTELGINDIQISLTSLEEVFLSIARKAEMEAAAAEGRTTIEVRLEDGSILEVELGAEYALQATTGRRFAVKWVQDEEGSLSVLSWKNVDSQSTNGNGNGAHATNEGASITA